MATDRPTRFVVDLCLVELRQMSRRIAVRIIFGQGDDMGAFETQASQSTHSGNWSAEPQFLCYKAPVSQILTHVQTSYPTRSGLSQDEPHGQGRSRIQDRRGSKASPAARDVQRDGTVSIWERCHQRAASLGCPVLQRVQGSQVFPRKRRVHTSVRVTTSQLCARLLVTL